MYQARPYILAENNWEAVKQTDYQVAILPWGATEAHNYHLPYATDNYQCDYVAAESAKWGLGAWGKAHCFSNCTVWRKYRTIGCRPMLKI